MKNKVYEVIVNRILEAAQGAQKASDYVLLTGEEE